jgi:RNA polymerase sigma-70 factor (ECF subfamily)
MGPPSALIEPSPPLLDRRRRYSETGRAPGGTEGAVALPRESVPARSDPAIRPEPTSDADHADALRDAETVARVVGGDRAAFGAVVARYGRRLHDLALRMLRDPHDAEDVAQQAFLNAYRALPRFDGRRPFRHWLLRIASNLCRNRLAERGRRGRPLSLSAGDGGDDARATSLEPAAAEAPAGEAYDLRRDAERVREAIGLLPETLRLAVVLRYTQGLSVEDVSEITETPVATVKTHLHRGRAALRRVLSLPTGPGETAATDGGTES